MEEEIPKFSFDFKEKKLPFYLKAKRFFAFCFGWCNLSAQTEISNDLYDKEINRIILRNLKIDLFARLVISIVAIGVFIYNIWYIDKLIYSQVAQDVILNYIKYGIGFSSLLILIIGYWFSKHGALTVLTKAMDHRSSIKQITVTRTDE